MALSEELWREEKARTVGTVGLNACHNVCGGYYLKGMASFVLSFCLLHRSEEYPGAPSKTPSVPTVASVR